MERKEEDTTAPTTFKDLSIQDKSHEIMEVFLDPKYVESRFKQFIENDLKLILDCPLDDKEQAVLLQMCRITFNAGAKSVKELVNQKPAAEIHTIMLDVRGEYVVPVELCASQILRVNKTTLIADGVIINFNSEYDI